jgi:hypothetical protein
MRPRGRAIPTYDCKVVAQAVGADLARFNAEVLTRSLSSFTGTVRYRPITDIDVETMSRCIRSPSTRNVP